MKKGVLLVFVLCFLMVYGVFGQYNTSKSSGGSVMTDVGNDYKVNLGSTLMRSWFTLNATGCPLQLKDVGLSTFFDQKYYFKPNGDLTATDSIVAYEIHHVMYDVFGRHLKTLRNFTCKDVKGDFKFNEYWSWGADLDEVSEYLVCVSYVAFVRTKDGKVWKYNADEVKLELAKSGIAYEGSYGPKTTE